VAPHECTGRLILPAASRRLTGDDWAAIEQAFHANDDPRFGAHADQSFADLASKLLNLAATSPDSSASQPG
jgi:hypothetical protein